MIHPLAWVNYQVIHVVLHDVFNHFLEDSSHCLPIRSPCIIQTKWHDAFGDWNAVISSSTRCIFDLVASQVSIHERQDFYEHFHIRDWKLILGQTLFKSRKSTHTQIPIFILLVFICQSHWVLCFLYKTCIDQLINPSLDFGGWKLAVYFLGLLYRSFLQLNCLTHRDCRLKGWHF